MSITAPYAEIAPTVAALKALTPELRCPNHCLFVPPLGSWVYYSATSTAAANDTTIFAPDDGLGRWILAQPATAPSGGSSGGSGITQQPGIGLAAATLADLQRATNQIISTLLASGVTQALTLTRNYDPADPTNDLFNLLGTDNGSATFVNPHPGKITNSASSIGAGTVASLTNRSNDDFYTGDLANSWVSFDLGTARTVLLNGLGLRCRNNIVQHVPVNLTIEGSNNGANFTPIFQWNNIGFTTANQDRFITFPASPSYRHIRIRQPGVNSSSTNFLALGEVFLFGTLSAL